MLKFFLSLVLIFTSTFLSAQYNVNYSIRIDRGFDSLNYAWVAGMNNPEFSEVDLNNDNIDYSISEEYGYVLESDYFNFFEDDDEENDYMNLELELDEDVLISFLNEYYEVNPKSLPKPEYY